MKITKNDLKLIYSDHTFDKCVFKDAEHICFYNCKFEDCIFENIQSLNFIKSEIYFSTFSDIDLFVVDRTVLGKGVKFINNSEVMECTESFFIDNIVARYSDIGFLVYKNRK